MKAEIVPIIFVMCCHTEDIQLPFVDLKWNLNIGEILGNSRREYNSD